MPVAPPARTAAPRRPHPPGAPAARRAGAAARTLLAALLLVPPPALGQGGGQGMGQGMGQGAGSYPGAYPASPYPPPGGSLLSPPSLPSALPSTLPGGLPLPNLGAGAQQDILQRMLDAAGRGGAAPPGYAPAPAPSFPGRADAPFPTPPPAPEEPQSGTEAFFAGRLDQPLRQFGYDTFRGVAGAPPPGTSYGALPEDYVVGRDDEVVVALRGRARQTLSLRVTRDGTLLFPDLPPVPAAGRTLRELRADLEARAERDLGASEVFVSIGQVRQMTVFVGGEVARPGTHLLTALASVLDALTAAGGVRRTGSLRALRVEGPRGTRVVDLYAVIAGAPGRPDLSLREGERIVVPPLGGVVAVAGEVARPAIYELPAGAARAPLASLLALAGGPLRPAGNRFLVQGTDAAGRRSFEERAPRDAVGRGDAVLVQPGSDVSTNQLRLAGHVTAPVTRAAGGRGATLRGLLGDPRLVRPDPYPRMAVVYRADPETRARRFVPFDLGRVLQGRADLRLLEGDEVVVLGQADVLWLGSPPVQRALRGQAPVPSPLQAAALAGGPGAPAGAPAGVPAGQAPGGRGAGGMMAVPGVGPVPAAPPGWPMGAGAGADCPALTQLAIAGRGSPQRFAHARGASFPDIGSPACPQVFQDYPALLPYLLDQAVLLTGEVRLPGLYPVTDDTGLDAVVGAAGGVLETADVSAVEFAREPTDQAGAIPLARTLLDLRSGNFAAVRLSPRDAVRIPRGFGDRDTGPVALMGEVLRPGTYDIRRGERLSEALARAGGLTPQAYPYGAVFTRESVRERQQEGFERTARELEQGMLQVAAGQSVARMATAPSDLAGAVVAGRQLADSLRQARAAGRMVVEANPVLLAARPELDVLLEPGDQIVIPKRPNEVTVVGAVLNPGSLQFATGWRAGQYVNAAGGPQRFADGARAFVVLPNGQSAPAGLSGWQAGGPPIPPGSLVVVPQDPSPYETWGFVRDLTGVLSQATISGAALAVIARAGRGQ